jgi:prepilin-type N-terminal cleavage/methylation domain-containing protein
MRATSRKGFTLIELMVAMALTLFIMVILSQAFSLALDTFSGIKGLGDMQADLRVATVLLRDDLSQDHFEGKRRLSDPNILTERPQAGFVAVLQPSAPATTNPSYTIEGVDANGLPSYRATDHLLYMTVKRKGNRAENFFNTGLQGDPTTVLMPFFSTQTAYNMNGTSELPNFTWAAPYPPPPTVPPTPPPPIAFYNSQWAEVLYYLVRTGSTEEPNVPTSMLGTPTYSLMRAQFVMVPNGTTVSTLYPNTALLEQTTFNSVSCNPNTGTGFLQFYSPADAANGQRVIPTLAAASITARHASAGTLVLPNVISFEVQMMPTGSNAFSPTVGLYESRTSAFGLKAIQVTLRVWDNKTRQTRQVTLVQDM